MGSIARLQRAAPEVPVGDIPGALAYYGDVLGFRTMMTMPDGDYAVVQRDDVALHLFKAEEGARPISFHVFSAGIEPLFGEMTEAGARIGQVLTAKPWGNRDFRVLDPFGNEIKFTEPLDD